LSSTYITATSYALKELSYSILTEDMGYSYESNSMSAPVAVGAPEPPEITRLREALEKQEKVSDKYSEDRLRVGPYLRPSLKGNT
jgi:hypothetical protein